MKSILKKALSILNGAAELITLIFVIFFKASICNVTGRDFLVLSHSKARTQRVYDRNSLDVFEIKTRDKIDREVVNQIFSKESYNLRFLKRKEWLFQKYLSIIDSGRTPLIMDLGANSGLAALYFSKIFPKSFILCVEPDEGNYLQAKKNTKGVDNILIVKAGISCCDGRGTVKNPASANWSFRTELNQDGEIQMISVPTLLKESPCQEVAPFISKIDIEGFEDNLFSSNTEWVNEFPLVIIELHDWMLPDSANSQNFLKCISLYKRDFVFRGENVYSIKCTEQAG
jgi:FkbM family methyltransferase